MESRPLKIAMLDRYAFPEKIGGAPRYFYDVARKLAEKGHSVHYIHCTWEKDGTGVEEKVGVTWHRYSVKNKGPLLNNIAYIQNTFRLAKKILDTEGLDLVYFQDSRVPLKLYSSSEFDRLPFLFMCQADSAFEYQFDYEKFLQLNPSLVVRLKENIKYPFFYRWHRYCMRKGLERTDRIVTLSHWVRSVISKNYGSHLEPKFRRIPSGVDIELFHPPAGEDEKQELRRKFNLPEDKILFLTARRMTLRMGWFNLVEAIKLLFDRNPGSRNEIAFVFCGGGVLLDAVKNKAAKLGVNSNITFTGSVYREMPQYYQAADCFILPTEELEGFGIVSIEAFATGIPTIGTPKSAVPEVLREADPELVTRNHLPDGLAEGIERIFQKIKQGQIDSTHFRRVAEEKFSWEVVINQIEEYILEIIDKKKSV